MQAVALYVPNNLSDSLIMAVPWSKLLLLLLLWNVLLGKASKSVLNTYRATAYIYEWLCGFLCCFCLCLIAVRLIFHFCHRCRLLSLLFCCFLLCKHGNGSINTVLISEEFVVVCVTCGYSARCYLNRFIFIIAVVHCCRSTSYCFN